MDTILETVTTALEEEMGTTEVGTEDFLVRHQTKAEVEEEMAHQVHQEEEDQEIQMTQMQEQGDNQMSMQQQDKLDHLDLNLFILTQN
ncbi:hypothetical protein FS749_010557 [Ceratobasidium sp. UAMH 11750]|nr:hypothetical protein FS749_010557 [Ceratobasidium sp. UAMH 11750]